MTAGDLAGYSVSNAGDVNGDGLADLIVGAPYDNPHGNDSGTGFVIFGRSGGVDLIAASDNGPSDNDNLTSITMPTIEFTVESGTVLEIDWDDGNGFQATGVATGLPQQATLMVPYATAGLKTVQVRTTDAAGSQHTEVLAITIEPIIIEGTGGNDTLIGNTHDNMLLGLAGNDILDGGAGADVLDGGTGFDKATYISAASGVLADIAFVGGNTGDATGDTFISIENLEGSTHDDNLRGDDSGNAIIASGGDDVVYGPGGDDRLLGNAGDDILIGGAGIDHYNGGNGTDRVQYQDSSNGLRVDLQVQGTNTGEAAGEIYLLIEDIVSSSGNDQLFGNASANKLYGFDGVDRVFGRAGNDILFGGDGNDIVNGGTGDDILVGGLDVDTFRFEGADFGSDRILDFTAGGGDRPEILCRSDIRRPDHCGCGRACGNLLRQRLHRADGYPGRRCDGKLVRLRDIDAGVSKAPALSSLASDGRSLPRSGPARGRAAFSGSSAMSCVRCGGRHPITVSERKPWGNAGRLPQPG